MSLLALKSTLGRVVHRKLDVRRGSMIAAESSVNGTDCPLYSSRFRSPSGTVPFGVRNENACMTETKLPTFDEFRTSHHDALRTQREHLRDDAHANDILREAGAAKGWPEWPNAIER